jgi:hypothetical protein
MQWVIDNICKNERSGTQVIKKRNAYVMVDKHSKKLRYCKNCDNVWEYEYVGRDYILQYKDFPTIGLQRECCKYCK